MCSAAVHNLVLAAQHSVPQHAVALLAVSCIPAGQIGLPVNPMGQDVMPMLHGEGWMPCRMYACCAGHCCGLVRGAMSWLKPGRITVR